MTEMLLVDMGKRRGRPPLPEAEKRIDLYCVRLNTQERRRLHRLSGLLDLVQLAEVFREGLVALEEREVKRAEPSDRLPGAAPKKPF